MEEFLTNLMPNVMDYTDKLWSSIVATVQMFLISGIFVFIFGLIFGIILTVSKKGGIWENEILFQIVDKVTNIFRSIPFIILLIFIIPFTRLIMGTAIGVKGAIVPLIFGATPFFTRQVEVALANVDPGKIEAATAMGSSKMGIIFRVYLHEAVPELFRVITVTAISLIGLTTMAGAVGAGGIGSFAINYGQNLHGVNSHRLLVRGHRIDNAASASIVRVTADAVRIEPALVAPLLAIPILVILLFIVVLKPQKKEESSEDVKEKIKS